MRHQCSVIQIDRAMPAGLVPRCSTVGLAVSDLFHIPPAGASSGRFTSLGPDLASTISARLGALARGEQPPEDTPVSAGQHTKPTTTGTTTREYLRPAAREKPRLARGQREISGLLSGENQQVWESWIKKSLSFSALVGFEVIGRGFPVSEMMFRSAGKLENFRSFLSSHVTFFVRSEKMTILFRNRF